MAAMAAGPMALRRAGVAAVAARGLAHSVVPRGGRPRHRAALPRTPWTVRGPPPEVLAEMVEPRPVREQVELDTITFAERLHYVPGLARPRFPPWQRGWHDPWHSPGPRCEEMPLYKERGCYICHQGVRMLEGTTHPAAPPQALPAPPAKGSPRSECKTRAVKSLAQPHQLPGSLGHI